MASFHTTGPADFLKKMREVGFLNSDNHHYNEFEVLKKFGEGSIKRFPLACGLQVSLCQMLLKTDFVYTFDVADKYLEFLFVQSGYLEWFCEAEQTLQTIAGGENSIFITPNCNGWLRHPGREPLLFLAINIDKHYIDSLKSRGIEVGEALDEFRRTHIRCGSNKTTPAIEAMISKYFLCSYDDVSFTKLLFEGITLELLSEYLFSSQRPADRSLALDNADIERLYMAKKILTERMSAPPSITQLSKLVCLNTFKLKTGFKTLFCQTPYGYLRAARMEKARWLLKNTRLSIEEISLQLGFSNGSSLSPIFKSFYGVTPSRFRNGRMAP